MMSKEKLLHRIRGSIIFFMVVLALSGITAFPVYTELKWMMEQQLFSSETAVGQWLNKVWLGVEETQRNNHFLFYGYDWLAFAHLVIAMAFIGPYKDPVRNKWIIEWGILCCVAIIPLAVIAGTIRDIPWFHILIDCSFGIIGIVPLEIVRRWITQLEKLQNVAT